MTDSLSCIPGSKFQDSGFHKYKFPGFRNSVIFGEKLFNLRRLNIVSRAVSGNSRDGACFKLDKQTWRQKKQWYTEDDFSKSTHENFVILGRIFTFIVF